MKVKFIIVLFGMFFIFFCKKPVKEDFIGNWESTDKSMIVLNKDNTCTINNIDSVKIWSKEDSFETKKTNRSGKWKFVSSTKSNSHYCIYINSDKGGFPLNVTGTDFIGYFNFWKLSVYAEDPGDMNFYKFYKQ
jgi:hypothetical protein